MLNNCLNIFFFIFGCTFQESSFLLKAFLKISYELANFSWFYKGAVSHAHASTFLSRRPRCHFITTKSFVNAVLLSSVKGEVSHAHTPIFLPRRPRCHFFTTKSFVNALLFTDSTMSLTHSGNFRSEAQCLFVSITHFFKSLLESTSEAISPCLV